MLSKVVDIFNSFIIAEDANVIFVIIILKKLKILPEIFITEKCVSFAHFAKIVIFAIRFLLNIATAVYCLQSLIKKILLNN